MTWILLLKNSALSGWFLEDVGRSGREGGILWVRFFGPLPEAEDQSSDIGICVVNKTHRRVYTGSRSLLW